MIKYLLSCIFLVLCVCAEPHSKKEYNENDYRGSGVPRFRIIEELGASASGQYSEDQFVNILAEIENKQKVNPSMIFVIDLREEAHFFANGIPFTATDKHEMPSKAFQYEREDELKKVLQRFDDVKIDPRLRDIDVKKKYEEKHKKMSAAKKEASLKRNHHRLWVNKTVHLKKPVIRTEDELAKMYGVQYIRLPLTDHFPPAREQMMKLQEVLQNLPKDAWVHVHCRGGEGRTTSVLAMMEMIKFRDREFMNILKHQHHLGGKNLAKIPCEESRKANSIERLKALRDIYDSLH